MANETWTVKEILRWTSSRFSQLDIPTPLLDAQLLLGSVLGLTKVQLYMQHERVLMPTERAAMRELVRRRVAGEPVAYLLKHKSWHELDLYVDRRVLIPRPETETLLDFVLEMFRASGRAPATILDLGTGSGCLAVALAKRFPRARVMGVDLSEEALEVARVNAQRNGVTNVEFLLGDVSKGALFDWMRNLPLRFDAIVANPPYVTEDEWQRCDVSVRDFEPKLALTAEDEGLALAKSIEEHVRRTDLLAADGVFAMEVGLSHCERLHAGGASSEPYAAFAYNTAAWRVPRGTPFALQDLTGRARFRCRVNGLPYSGMAAGDLPDATVAPTGAEGNTAEGVTTESDEGTGTGSGAADGASSSAPASASGAREETVRRKAQAEYEAALRKAEEEALRAYGHDAEKEPEA